MGLEGQDRPPTDVRQRRPAAQAVSQLRSTSLRAPAPAITTSDRQDCGSRSGRQGARPGGTGLRLDQPADLPSLRLQALHGHGHGPLHPIGLRFALPLYGLLRDYFPKGTDLSTVTPEAL